MFEQFFLSMQQDIKLFFFFLFFVLFFVPFSSKSIIHMTV